MWERSLSAEFARSQPAQSQPTALITPQAGALTGYLSALGCSLGNSGGALSPALFEAGKAWQANLLVQPSDNGNFHYLDAKLKPSEMLKLGQQVEGGPRYCQGVACVGIWNENEEKALTSALANLKRVAPALYPRLKGVVVQTWVGSDQPEALLARPVGGTFTSHSPDIVRVQRAVLAKPDDIEGVLAHEFAHVIDWAGMVGYRSTHDGPFRKFPDPRHCVSPYASTATHEDFAETFRYCAKNFDKMMAHSDLYFHALGPLSKKFRYVVQNTLGHKIPPPSPQWTELKADLNAGKTPFGWRDSQGAVQQAMPAFESALSEIALKWNFDDLGKNLELVQPGKHREALEYLAHRFLGGKAPGSVDTAPSLAQISERLAEYASLSQPYAQRNERIAQINATCQEMVSRNLPVEKVPQHLSARTSLVFGQLALALDKRLEKLDTLPDSEWKTHLLQGCQDGTLKEALALCQEPAQQRSVASARMEELLEKTSLLHERGQQTPQACDVVYQESREMTLRYAELNQDLGNLLKAGGQHLNGTLAKFLSSRGQSGLLPALRHLAPR